MNSSARQPLVDGVAAQVSEDTAEVGAIIDFGRAKVWLPEITFCETMVTVELDVDRYEVAACQVVAAGSTFANVVVVPLVSFTVKDPVSEPVRVRYSDPGSGFQPPALVAVNPTPFPLESSSSTDVAEVWRILLQSEPFTSAATPEIQCHRQLGRVSGRGVVRAGLLELQGETGTEDHHLAPMVVSHRIAV
jgi:hypothetical protein